MTTTAAAPAPRTKPTSEAFFLFEDALNAALLAQIAEQRMQRIGEDFRSKYQAYIDWLVGRGPQAAKPDWPDVECHLLFGSAQYWSERADGLWKFFRYADDLELAAHDRIHTKVSA